MDYEKTEYKDFFAEVTDGRLRVWHYNHEEDLAIMWAWSVKNDKFA